MKINRKWKLLSTIIIGFMSIGLVSGVVYNLVSNDKSLTSNNNTSFNAATSTTTGVTTPLSSYNAYSGLQTITNKIGPMLISDNGKTFGNYDWYGNLNWSITLNNTETGLYPKSGTKVVDWNYISDKGYLYVITDTAYMFCIDSVSGNVIASVSQTESGIAANSNKLATIALNNQLYVWNSNAQNPTVYSVDRTTLKAKTSSFSTSTNSDLNNKYLLNILQLSNDIGFNIAITSSTSPNSSISSVNAYFVTNSLQQFTPSSGSSSSIPTQSISLTGISSSENLYVNTFYHSITNSYTLIVGNNLYSISLSTNAMEKSQITQFTTNNITLTNINSGFIDSNNDIYFTDTNKKIYTVNPDGKTVSQYYDLSSISYLSSYISDSNVTTQIFPVNNSSGNLLQGQIFVVTSNANFGGVSNKTAVGTSMFNSTSVKPTISVANESVFNSLIPSAVTYNNFVASNADSLTSSNMQFTVDDKNGTLVVKATLTKQAWYNSSEKTTSIINANYQLKTASEVTSWATQDVFSSIGGGYFANKSPNQISTEDFDKYADQVLIISPSLLSAVQSDSLTKTFVIVSAQDDKIKVMATVSYVDQYGTFVTYSVNENEYTVKSTTDTKFAFQGQTTYISGSTLDVNTVPALSNYKGYLPSLLSQDDLSNFIAVEDGYPTSSQRRIITSSANDDSGNITINVVYIGIDPSTQNNFSITYTGFPTFTSSKIKWNGTTIQDLKENEMNKTDASTRDEKLLQDIEVLQKVYGDTPVIDITTISSYVNYGSILSTDITPTQVNLVYTTLLSNMGFQPVLTIDRSNTDNEYGVITIKLDYRNSKGTNGELLTNSFLEKLGIISTDDSNKQEIGVISQKFSGFLPISTTYGVTLKAANSSEIQNVINNNNVNSIIPGNDLLSTLNIRGYGVGDDDGNVSILNTSWDGEKLLFTVRAESVKYPSVSKLFNFTIDWAPKFASIRERNLIIATVVSIAGVAIVAGAITAYVMRKNKIRRLLK